MAAKSWDPKQPRIVKNDSIAEIAYGITEANSQSFKAGALVKYSSGVAALVTATSAAQAVLGIAQKDATNVTSGNIEIPVQLVSATDTLLIRVSSDGTAALSSTLTPLTDYGIHVDTNGVATLDSSETTNVSLVFIEPVYDVNGDATYWAKCRVMTDGTNLLQADQGA